LEQARKDLYINKRIGARGGNGGKRWAHIKSFVPCQQRAIDKIKADAYLWFMGKNDSVLSFDLITEFLGLSQRKILNQIRPRLKEIEDSGILYGQ
jgi:hypothetical protein